MKSRMAVYTCSRGCLSSPKDVQNLNNGETLGGVCPHTSKPYRRSASHSNRCGKKFTSGSMQLVLPHFRGARTTPYRDVGAKQNHTDGNPHRPCFPVPVNTTSSVRWRDGGTSHETEHNIRLEVPLLSFVQPSVRHHMACEMATSPLADVCAKSNPMSPQSYTSTVLEPWWRRCLFILPFQMLNIRCIFGA